MAIKNRYTQDEFIDIIITQIEKPIEHENLLIDNFQNKISMDKNENFIYSIDSNDIRHNFVIIKESNDPMKLTFGFSFRRLDELDEPEDGKITINIEKGELELSSGYEEFYFDEEVVEDFFLEVMAITFKAAKQVVEDFEGKDS